MSCTLTPEQLVVLQARLDEARIAYHELLTGVKPRVVVDQNGERVEFSATNRQQLYLYIKELEAILCPAPSNSPNNYRPMGFTF
jgi:hypothetical protein